MTTAGEDPEEVEERLKSALLQIELDFLEAKMRLREQFGLDTLEIQKEIEDMRLGIIREGIEQEIEERRKGIEEGQQDLQNILNADHAASLKQQALSSLFKTNLQGNSASRKQQQNEKIIIETIVAVMHASSASQKQKLRDSLQQTSQMFRQLALR